MRLEYLRTYVWEESGMIVQKQASWRGVRLFFTAESVLPFPALKGGRVPPLALGVVAARIDALAVYISNFILQRWRAGLAR